AHFEACPPQLLDLHAGPFTARTLSVCTVPEIDRVPPVPSGLPHSYGAARDIRAASPAPSRPKPRLQTVIVKAALLPAVASFLPIPLAWFRTTRESDSSPKVEDR